MKTILILGDGQPEDYQGIVESVIFIPFTLYTLTTLKKPTHPRKFDYVFVFLERNESLRSLQRKDTQRERYSHSKTITLCVRENPPKQFLSQSSLN